jgi:integrase
MPDYITPIMLERYKSKRLKEHPGINRQINLEILCLKSMVRWASEQVMCNNPLPKSKPLPYRRPVPEYIRREELMAIIDCMGLKHKILFLCLYQAGLRKSEACQLKNLTFILILIISGLPGKAGKHALFQCRIC